MSTELTQAQVASLNDNWLDGRYKSTPVGPIADDNVLTTGSSMAWTGDTWTWPYNIQYPGTYYVNWGRSVSPVRLTLTEVERLRAAAKKDAKLKEVLRKFTHAIEIEVDFP